MLAAAQTKKSKSKDKMKEITFFTKVRNYTKTGRHKKVGLEKSIAHSMRVGNSLNHRVNHIPKLSNQNRFFLFEDDLRHREVDAMDAVAELQSDLSKMENEKELSESAKKDRDRILDSLCWIRAKFDKYKCKSEEEQKFWQDLKSCADVEICKSFREKFDEIDVARRNQKSAQIEKYIDTLSELEEKNYGPRKKRGENLKTIMQEQIFKIPLHNKVGLDKVDVNIYVELVKNLNKEISPNSHLKAVAMHLDEKGISKENYGLHAHAFVSGADANGELNLLQNQIKWAEEYCINNSPELHEAFKKDCEIELRLLQSNRDENCKNQPEFEEYFNSIYAAEAEKLNGKLHGRLWQESVKVFTNKFFDEKGLGLHIEHKYKTRGNKALLTDQDLPIAEREFNGSVMRLQESFKMEQGLKVQIDQKHENIKDLTIEEDKLKKEIEITNEEINNNRRIIQKLENDNFELNMNNKSLSDEVEMQQGKLNLLRKNISKFFSIVQSRLSETLAAIVVEPAKQEELENACADDILDRMNEMSRQADLNEDEINGFACSIKDAIEVSDLANKTKIAPKFETKARKLKF